MMQPKLRRRAKMRRCGRKRRKHNTRLKTAPNNSYTAKNKRRTKNNRMMLRSMINLTSSLMMRRHMIKKTSKRILQWTAITVKMRTRNYLDKLPPSNKNWKSRRDYAMKKTKGNVSRLKNIVPPKLRQLHSKPSKRKDRPNSNKINANVTKRRPQRRKLRLKRRNKNGKRRPQPKRNWRMNKRKKLRKRRRRKRFRPRQLRPNSNLLRILIWDHQEECQLLQWWCPWTLVQLAQLKRVQMVNQCKLSNKWWWTRLSSTNRWLSISRCTSNTTHCSPNSWHFSNSLPKTDKELPQQLVFLSLQWAVHSQWCLTWLLHICKCQEWWIQMLRQVINLLLSSNSSCPEWFQLCLLSIHNRPARTFQDSMHLKPKMSKSDPNSAQRWLIKLMKLILRLVTTLKKLIIRLKIIIWLCVNKFFRS